MKLSACFRQVADLLARGVRRPLALGVTASCFAALLTAYVVGSKNSYAPSYVLRVVESDRDPTRMPRPRRQLADYIRLGVFTSEPLLELIRQHGLYPSLARKNPHAAIESAKTSRSMSIRTTSSKSGRSGRLPGQRGSA